ncbi:MAG: hypothetical protein ABIO06_01185 [Pseudolysinimonas sp.]
MSETEWLTVASVVIPLAVVGLLMIRGWRALRRRQDNIVGLAPVPSAAGAPILTEDLLYVATTRAEQPLQRIAAHGLGFRARAVLAVSTAGIRLDLAGGKPGFIPAAALHGVGRATWTIDRAISNDGLVFVRWSDGARPDGATPAGTLLDSYFRSADPPAMVAAIERLIPTPREAAA